VAGSVFAVDDRGGGLVYLPGPYGTDVAAQPASRTLAARVRSDEGALQWGGVLAARRYEAGRGENTVLGPDLHWTIDDAWRLRAQWLHARSSAQPDAQGDLQGGPARDGNRLYLHVNRNSPGHESEVIYDDVGDGFRHDSGFVSQAGVRTLKLFHGVAWRGVGPFHEFWLNLHVNRTQQRHGGRTIEQQVYPGLWATADRNVEWFAEAHLLGQLRATPQGPLMSQRYLSTGLIITPAPWFPLLDTTVSLGRLADTQDEQLRPGLRWTTTAKLRPLPRLELEPTWSTSWLRGDGRRRYDEGLLNLLAVWHLGPRSHLRLIVQRTALDRGAQGQPVLALAREQTQSLTWSWRWSAGTVVYVGASRTRSGVAGVSRGNEAFVKLQADLDDARSWWAGS
jgi:hypothetical protein